MGVGTVKAIGNVNKPKKKYFCFSKKNQKIENNLLTKYLVVVFTNGCRVFHSSNVRLIFYRKEETEFR